MPSLVFIDCAWEDRQWLQRLLTHLRPFQREGRFEAWSELLSLDAGCDAALVVAEAIDKASIAILLISANYLACDAAALQRLPRMRSLRRHGRLTILPIVLGPCAYSQTGTLQDIQPLNDPSAPLLALAYHDQERELARVAEHLCTLTRYPRQNNMFASLPATRRESSALALSGSDFAIRRLISMQLSIDIQRVCDDASWSEDLQADELDKLDLVLALEKMYGVRIDRDGLGRAHTVGELIRHIERTL